MRRTLLVAVIATLTMALAAPAAHAKQVKLEVLSSKPHIGERRGRARSA